MPEDILLLLFTYFLPIKLKENHATRDKSGRTCATKKPIDNIKQRLCLAYEVGLVNKSVSEGKKAHF